MGTLGGGATAVGGQSRPGGTHSSSSGTAPAERHPGLVTIAATESPDVEQWDARITRMLKIGAARVRDTTADALVPGRTLQQISQLYKGVPVFGGELTRQIEDGRTISVFGTLYENIRINPVPKLTTTEATAIFQQLAGDSLGPSRTPELIVLPTDDGSYRLTYRSRIATADDVMMYFVDADSGETVLSFSDLKRPVK
jgi:Zn-dependent metalloprotease